MTSRHRPDTEPVQNNRHVGLEQNRPVVFIGPMASGKSSIGRRVARRLNASFFDTDQSIVAEYGSISDYFRDHGEPAFREIEAAAVRIALRSAHDSVLRGIPSIVSLGGGAVLHPGTRSLLEKTNVVLLLTTEEAVIRRSNLKDRPLLAEDPGAWSRILEARLPLYRSLATVTFDAADRSKDDIADDIVRWFIAGSAVKTEERQ
ncbi:shikimate kinase [Lysinibacter sp. HNR]|uniref:shikimate kinase n=1 Tax=Lysinibacter sp. HNR TaxID=3031408 RepID=UPI002435138A|nr:shikimate kinase [Lysinibacter sp. HNR]WGD36292.1 shikimate kinase [Lysinibacter sp. HNR]